MVEFAYYTGWRIPSEVLRLTWAQVDFSAGVVRLEPRTTKNDEGRTFPFDALPELAALLRAQRERTTEIERRLGIIVTAVFHRDGKPIHYFGGRGGRRGGGLRSSEMASSPGLCVPIFSSLSRTISTAPLCAT